MSTSDILETVFVLTEDERDKLEDVFRLVKLSLKEDNMSEIIILSRKKKQLIFHRTTLLIEVDPSSCLINFLLKFQISKKT